MELNFLAKLGANVSIFSREENFAIFALIREI